MSLLKIVSQIFQLNHYLCLIIFFHSLDANVSALTNFEVLDFLRSKGASKDPSRVIAKVAMSEYKVSYSVPIIYYR
jgi:hypothetical protein